MGRAVGDVYLDFSKDFNIASRSFFLYKMARFILDGWAVRWVGDWLTGSAC